MLTTRLLICLGILAPTTPALSAQFFIVQDSATNRCTITEQPPDPGAAVSNPLPTSPPYPTPSQSTPSRLMPTSTVLVGMVPMASGPPRKLTCERLLPASGVGNSIA